MRLQLQIKNRFDTSTENATTDAEPMRKELKYRRDYIGERFGSLVVIAYPVSNNWVRRAGAYCKCDCGEIMRVFSIGDLVNGTVHRCKNCSRKAMSESAKKRWRETPSVSRRKYGDLQDERLFHVWMSMKGRCGKESGYKDVSVCHEWLDYRVFREWAYSHGYDDKAPRGECTIDRINPFGNYEPKNCRFVDMREQARNKRKKWEHMDEETRRALAETIAASI